MFGMQSSGLGGAFLGGSLPSESAVQHSRNPTELQREHQLMLYHHYMNQMRMLQPSQQPTGSEPSAGGLSLPLPLPGMPPLQNSQQLPAALQQHSAPPFPLPTGNLDNPAPFMSQPALASMLLHQMAGAGTAQHGINALAGTALPQQQTMQQVAAAAAAAQLMRSMQQQSLPPVPPWPPTGFPGAFPSGGFPPGTDSNTTINPLLSTWPGLPSTSPNPGAYNPGAPMCTDLTAKPVDVTEQLALPAALPPPPLTQQGSLGLELPTGPHKLPLLTNGEEDHDNDEHDDDSMQHSEEDSTEDEEDVKPAIKAGALRCAPAPILRAGRPRGQPNSHTTDPAEKEAKKQRRKQSNRDSARRSRIRKQAEMIAVADMVERLANDTEDLNKQVTDMNSKAQHLEQENMVLRELAAVTKASLDATGQLPSAVDISPFRARLKQLGARSPHNSSPLNDTHLPGSAPTALLQAPSQGPAESTSPHGRSAATMRGGSMHGAPMQDTGMDTAAMLDGDADIPLLGPGPSGAPIVTLPDPPALARDRSVHGESWGRLAAADFVGRQKAAAAAAAIAEAQAEAELERCVRQGSSDGFLDDVPAGDMVDRPPSPLTESDDPPGPFGICEADFQAPHARARIHSGLLGEGSGPLASDREYGAPVSPITDHLLASHRRPGSVVGISGRYSVKVQGANSNISLSGPGSEDSDMLGQGKSLGVTSSGLGLGGSRIDLLSGGGGLSGNFGEDATVAAMVEQDCAAPAAAAASQAPRAFWSPSPAPGPPQATSWAAGVGSAAAATLAPAPMAAPADCGVGPAAGQKSRIGLAAYGFGADSIWQPVL